VKKFASPRAFIGVASVVAPGCVIDIRSSEGRQTPAPGKLNASRDDLPVVVMASAQGDVDAAVQTIKAGAVDYLEASSGDARLLTAVVEALAGIAQAEDDRRETELNAVRIGDMSAREREVLERLLAGGTNKTIARDLGISPRTVEFHRAHVMERLGAHNLPEAVRLALAAGLTPPRANGVIDEGAS
jgi:FixJ family two-component response regulator